MTGNNLVLYKALPLSHGECYSSRYASYLLFRMYTLWIYIKCLNLEVRCPNLFYFVFWSSCPVEPVEQQSLQWSGGLTLNLMQPVLLISSCVFHMGCRSSVVSASQSQSREPGFESCYLESLFLLHCSTSLNCLNDYLAVHNYE